MGSGREQWASWCCWTLYVSSHSFCKGNYRCFSQQQIWCFFLRNRFLDLPLWVLAGYQCLCECPKSIFQYQTGELKPYWALTQACLFLHPRQKMPSSSLSHVCSYISPTVETRYKNHTSEYVLSSCLCALAVPSCRRRSKLCISPATSQHRGTLPYCPGANQVLINKNVPGRLFWWG